MNVSNKGEVEKQARAHAQYIYIYVLDSYRVYVGMANYNTDMKRLYRT